jgi:hypothetical protein
MLHWDVAHCMLYIACLGVARYVLHKMHVASCTLHLVRCILYDASFMLHAARCMLLVACYGCMLRSERRALHRARGMLLSSSGDGALRLRAGLRWRCARHVRRQRDVRVGGDLRY